MTRVLSGAALVAVLVAVVWFLPPWATLALGALAAMVAAVELVSLYPAARRSTFVAVSGLSTAVVAVALALNHPLGSTPSPGSVLVTVLVAVVISGGAAALSSGDPAPGALPAIGLMFMTPLYVGVPVGVYLWVRVGWGREALLLPIVIVAASDIAQYYSGQLFGRHRLAPRVSPSKTVEGSVGGLAAAALVGALLAPAWLGIGLAPTQAVSPILGAGLGVLLGLGGMVGDLFESFLKRSAGVKDSSGILPGHGGVLDRVDSHLFAAPLYYLFLRYLA